MSRLIAFACRYTLSIGFSRKNEKVILFYLHAKMQEFLADWITNIAHLSKPS